MKQHKKYKAIFFDIDDTLCNTQDSKEKVSEGLYNTLDKFRTVSLKKFKTIFASQRKKYFKSTDKRRFNTYSRPEHYNDIAESLKIKLNIPELRTVIEKYWEFSIKFVKPYPNLVNTLQKLHEKKYILGIITGGEYYSKSKKLEQLKADTFFYYLFPTELVRRNKTDPAIYTYVLKLLNINPHEAVMIGDKPAEDIAPANKVGMTTVQAMMCGTRPLAKKGLQKPDYAIYDLQELLNIF